MLASRSLVQTFLYRNDDRTCLLNGLMVSFGMEHGNTVPKIYTYFLCLVLVVSEKDRGYFSWIYVLRSHFWPWCIHAMMGDGWEQPGLNPKPHQNMKRRLEFASKLMWGYLTFSGLFLLSLMHRDLVTRIYASANWVILGSAYQLTGCHAVALTMAMPISGIIGDTTQLRRKNNENTQISDSVTICSVFRTPYNQYPSQFNSLVLLAHRSLFRPMNQIQNQYCFGNYHQVKG